GETDPTPSVYGAGGGGATESTSAFESVSDEAEQNTRREGSDFETNGESGRRGGPGETEARESDGIETTSPSRISDEAEGEPLAGEEAGSSGTDREVDTIGSNGQATEGSQIGAFEGEAPRSSGSVLGALSAEEGELRSDDYLNRPKVEGEWVEPSASEPDPSEGVGDLMIDGVFIREETLIEIPDLEVSTLGADELLQHGDVRGAITLADALAGGWEQVDAATHNSSDFAAGGYQWRCVGIDPGSSRLTVYQGHVDGNVLAGEFELAFEGDTLKVDAINGDAPFPVRSRGIVAMGGEYLGPVDDLPASIVVRRMDGDFELGGKRYRRVSADRFNELRFGIGGARSPDAGERRISAPRSGPGAGPHQIDFFGIPPGVHRICFIVDRSPSMAMDDRIGRVKGHLKETIASLKAGTYFELVFFGGTRQADTIDGVGWAKANRAGKSKCIDAIDGVGANGGGTDPESAVRYAFRSLSPRPDLIVFLTDGLISPAIPALLDQLNDGDPMTKINTIAIGDGCNEPFLRGIAQSHGGRFRRVD
ncbi:VWA domain-containing protein, partial [bacterium]|nr:VWA domain-containing protein [bacterium]